MCVLLLSLSTMSSPQLQLQPLFERGRFMGVLGWLLAVLHTLKGPVPQTTSESVILN